MSDAFDNERSPIFLQFLDCVWQLTCIYPSCFEFNSNFLIFIIENLYACKFGTFLFNSELERCNAFLTQRTVSMWTWANYPPNKEDFVNPFYLPAVELFHNIPPYKISLWDYHLKNVSGKQNEISLTTDMRMRMVSSQSLYLQTTISQCYLQIQELQSQVAMYKNKLKQLEPERKEDDKK